MKLKNSNSRPVTQLITLAAACAQAATAQNNPEPELRLYYYFYEDWQGRDQAGSDQDRMQISNPAAFINLPLSDAWTAQATFTYDTLSGASPLYHDTLTGASGLGVGDERWAGNLTIIKSFENYEVIIGSDYSEEQDYLSLGGNLQVNRHSDNRNTTYSVGISGSSNKISATNNPDLQESSSSIGLLLGLTQTLNYRSILQTNLTYSSSSGYLNDQYKLADNRPNNRAQLAYLNRYRLYFPELMAALHLDYRFFLDSWNIKSHMLETAWQQELGDNLTLRPLVRLYTQSAASFYDPLFPPEETGFYTADQRLAGLGSFSAGLKIEYQLAQKLTLMLIYESLQQRNSWRVGSKGSPKLSTFMAQFTGLGMTYRW